jgi:predicted  nucleic acid-binding Zn-ribbon protein
MTVAEEQRKLEEEIADLRREQAKIKHRITKRRERLDQLQKEHGNVLERERKEREWREKRPEFEARRQTPEWQAARREFQDAMTDFPTGPKFKTWLNQ